MRHEHRWLAAALLLVSVVCVGCKQSGSPVEDAADEVRPATVVHSKGTQPSRVTLTEDAMKRVDVHTDPVRDAVIDGSTQRVIPYDAVLYDENGDTWTYVNPEPRVFVRTHVKLERISGGLAVLVEGPATGVAVVTVGGAELFGAESEFEEE
jgi:hypothetical protein